VGRRHNRVLGDSVSAFAQYERPVVRVRRRRLHDVEPGRGLDAETELAQRLHVWLDGAGAEVAAAGVRQTVCGGFVQQRPEQHDDAAGPAGCLHVHGTKVQHCGAADLQIVRVEPGALDADTGQHFDDPVDFLDPGQPAQRRGAAVDQAGAQQGNAGVLAAVDIDGSGQRVAALDPQVRHLRPANLDNALAEN
jgi:hypothetical protein